MQYTTLHDIKRVITSFENSINKASKVNASNKASNASKDLLVSDSTCKGLYLYLRQARSI